MKYLKSFELATGGAVDYDIGDTIICTNEIIHNLRSTKHNPLINGAKYKALKLYNTPEDKFLKTPYLRVDVENLDTGEISRGWESNRFKIEFEADADKYNI